MVEIRAGPRRVAAAGKVIIWGLPSNKYFHIFAAEDTNGENFWKQRVPKLGLNFTVILTHVET